MKFLILIFLARTGWAQNTSLKMRAMQELSTVPASANATRADSNDSTIGILTLKDPKPTAVPERWHFYLQVSAQSFQPKGHIGNGLTNSKFNFGSDGKTIMPAVEAGFTAPLYRNAWHWRWGIAGQAAYASQKASTTFSTGYSDSDVHLNSTLLAFAPFLSFQIPRWRRLTFDVGFEDGVLDYTQSSSNEFSNVNTHAAYWGASFAAELAVWRGWHLLARESRRSLFKRNAEVGLQTDALELGVKAIW